MRRVLYLWVPHLHTAVERGLAPGLAGQPVVVIAGSFARGVVVDASPEAEALGVGAGQSARHARRHAPGAIFIPYERLRYRPFTERIGGMLHELTPWVETLPGSEEEFFAYLGTGSLEEGEMLARGAVDAIRETLGLGAWAGLATGKLVARTACRVSGVPAFRRSGGIHRDGQEGQDAGFCPPGSDPVHPGNPVHPVNVGAERRFLRPLSLDYLWDMPPEHRRRLGPLGLRAFGQLAAVPQRMLVEQFGPVGRWYRLLAAGIDARRVKPWAPHPTISSRLIVEEDAADLPLLEGYLELLARRVSDTLIATGQYARVISVMLEMKVEGPGARGQGSEGKADSSSSLASEPSLLTPQPFSFASRHLKAPTNLAEPIRWAGHELLVGLLRQVSDARRQAPVKTPEGRSVRTARPALGLQGLASGAWRLASPQALTLFAGGLEARGLIQLSLFGDPERGPRLRAAIARIQDRFGEAAIVSAASVGSGQSSARCPEVETSVCTGQKPPSRLSSKTHAGGFRPVQTGVLTPGLRAPGNGGAGGNGTPD